MKSYEIYACRRKALRLTRQELADKAGVQVLYVEFFEKGCNIPRYVSDKIKATIRNEFCEMNSIDHYRTRILEMAIEIKDETNTEYAMQRISHMMIELGKLQNELMGVKLKTKEDWA